MLLRAHAPAKVNLTLHVLGRRPDGFHELDSLVVFAGCAADALTFEPGRTLALAEVSGPFAGAAGAGDDNLVLRACRAAAERIEGLRLGTFCLTKRIPVAAGLGGGSADAGAALRLLAQENGLAPNDPRLVEAAAATGSDVSACLLSRACRMTGTGDRIAPWNFSPLAAVLANPLKGVATSDVFRALRLARGGEALALKGAAMISPGAGGEGSLIPDVIAQGRNDLEPPACELLPDITLGLDALRALEGCDLARMSGSGATVFGLFAGSQAARRAARALAEKLPGWWIRPTLLR